MLKPLGVCVLASCLAPCVRADVRLPALISDHMVLQQGFEEKAVEAHHNIAQHHCADSDQRRSCIVQCAHMRAGQQCRSLDSVSERRRVYEVTGLCSR